MIGRYQVKDLDEMLPTIPFSSAEVEAKAIAKEMWNDSSRARPVAQSVGGRSKVLEVRAMSGTTQVEPDLTESAQNTRRRE